MSEMMRRPARHRKALEDLIEKARNHVMTPEEREAQRKSWVVGNMLLDHPEMPRETAERIYDNLEKPL